MAVTFKKFTPAQTEQALMATLKGALKNFSKVLLFVSGGSSISLVVQVLNQVSEADSAKLAILLTDERFGDSGFPDSNLQQYYEAGLDPKHATVVPVLRPGVALAETVTLYAEAAQTALEAADYSIGWFGMGTDGHIAGILPDSAATKATKKWAISYEARPFTRLTLTPFAFSHLSEAAITVFDNPSKKEALENLKKRLSITKQPAQLLKKLSKLTVFNDQIGA